MKCVFAVVALLHFCYSTGNSLNFTLNKEIIQRLDELNRLYQVKKLNFTSPEALRTPSANMQQIASSCVSVFTRELEHLLNHTIIHINSMDILEELKANLKVLQPHRQQIDHRCRMEQHTRSVRPFKPYTTFLKKLNLRKR